MTYDHWKSTNPEDEWLGSTHDEGVRCDLRDNHECACETECTFIRADAISALYRASNAKRVRRINNAITVCMLGIVAFGLGAAFAFLI